MAISKASCVELRTLGGLVEQYVPTYEPNQHDPMIAAEQGRGSCVAKALVAACYGDTLQFVNGSPSFAWSHKTHPKSSANPFGVDNYRAQRPLGHGQLLLPNKDQSKIWSLSFNPAFRRASDKEVYVYADLEGDNPDNLTIKDGYPVTTDDSPEGLVAGPWQESYGLYLDAADIPRNRNFLLSQTEMQSLVISSINARIDG